MPYKDFSKVHFLDIVDFAKIFCIIDKIKRPSHLQLLLTTPKLGAQNNYVHFYFKSNEDPSEVYTKLKLI